MREIRNIGRLVPAAVAALAVIAPTAFGQTPGTLPGTDAGWLQWVVGLGVAVVILITGFLNPKRSHLA